MDSEDVQRHSRVWTICLSSSKTPVEDPKGARILSAPPPRARPIIVLSVSSSASPALSRGTPPCPVIGSLRSWLTSSSRQLCPGAPYHHLALHAHLFGAISRRVLVGYARLARTKP